MRGLCARRAASGKGVSVIAARGQRLRQAHEVRRRQALGALRRIDGASADGAGVKHAAQGVAQCLATLTESRAHHLLQRRAIHRRQVAIAEKSKALSQIASLAASYRQRDFERRQLEERLRTPVRLFTLVDELSKRQGIEIGDMQDRGTTTGSDKISESIVEFDVNKLTLDKLTSFLNAIEHAGHLVKVKKIRIRARIDDPNSVDASLTVATYSMGAT